MFNADNMINHKNQNSLCVVTQKKETIENDEESNICKPPPKLSIMQLMKSLIPKDHVNQLQGLQLQNQQQRKQQPQQNFKQVQEKNCYSPLDDMAGGFERT